MRILTRYILLEVAKVFLMALAGLTVTVVLGFGLREGLRNGLPPVLILETMLYMMPETLGITMPVAMLLAVSFAYGRMAGTNELVALKSLGINPLALVWPVLLMAFALSLATVWIYDVTAIWGRPNVQRLIVESVEEVAYGMLQANRSYRSPKFSIAVKRVEGRRLIQPAITLHAQGSSPEVTLRAAEAELEAHHREGTLRIYCRNGEVEVDGQAQLSFPDTLVHEIPFETPERPIHRDWLAMREMPEHVADLRNRVAELQRELESVDDDSKKVERKRQLLKEWQWRIHRIRTEPYRRWANGFTCLCFTFVGIPVAMAFRFDSFLANFFACFLPILAVYYPLLMFQEDLTTSGLLPPVFFWLGNVVLIGPGIWLMRRVIRY